ncbi:MAG: branched-chain amino acid ABC transporter permease [bacterium]
MSERVVTVRSALALGLISGTVAVFLSLVGLVEVLHARPLVAGLSLGQALLLATALGAGAIAARRGRGGIVAAGLGTAAGAAAGAVMAVFVLLPLVTNLRGVFPNASPGLFALLTLGRPAIAAVPLLVLIGGLAGAAGAAIMLVSPRVRRPMMYGLATVLVLSLFQDLIQLLLQSEGLATSINLFLYAEEGGPSTLGAVTMFALVAALSAGWAQEADVVRSRLAGLPASGRRTLRWVVLAAAIAAVLFVPILGGSFVAQVLVVVGLYTLMGLGLNLEVGLAGLLDLGFVAFFAIGAYTVGLLTSVGTFGIAHWSFWSAIPVAVLTALIAGVVFGIPVLGIRGDYLAIATLGFGEITRLLVASDFLRPWLGGSQGVLEIPPPVLALTAPGLGQITYEFGGPDQIFYLTLISSAVVVYFAWRLQHSRLGRAWMAIREDEDVAEALGVHLVSVKLLAYGLGAAFAGVAGAIFAVMVGSIFPHSFQLLVSINVLALIIVGGIGSNPGVVVGALALVGLPELLREFGEFRFLIYGAVLVAMMLLRPAGLLPAPVMQRELHEEEPEAVPRETVELAEAKEPNP